MRSLALLLVVVAAASAYKSYIGYQTFRIFPENEEQTALVAEFQKSRHFDFWSEIPRSGPIDLMVSPEASRFFMVYMATHDIKYQVKVADVGRTVEAQRTRMMNLPKVPQGKITFDSYHRHAEINAYLDQIAATYPSVASVEIIGTSYFGLQMKMLKVSSGPGHRAVLIDGGLHAREWISPAQTLYIIQELLENPANAGLYATRDWFILPVLNPDGYEYTFTTDRLWRKTLSPGSLCDGTDGNRNFAFHWGEVGASNFECDETYMGTAPFSEPETGNLRDFVLRNQNIDQYLTFHSYGMYLLYPWGYTSALPSDWPELDALAQSANNAIVAAGGPSYTIGSSTNVLYAAAGGSDDWCKGSGNVKYSYTIELPDNSFELPPSQIATVVSQTWQGVKVFVNAV